MLHIYTDGDDILVEQYFVTLTFDRAEVEQLIINKLFHDYTEHIYKIEDEEGQSYETSFTFYNDDERFHVINDLMYYHQLEPIKIKFINNEHE